MDIEGRSHMLITSGRGGGGLNGKIQVKFSFPSPFSAYQHLMGIWQISDDCSFSTESGIPFPSPSHPSWSLFQNRRRSHRHCYLQMGQGILTKEKPTYKLSFLAEEMFAQMIEGICFLICNFFCRITSSRRGTPIRNLLMCLPLGKWKSFQDKFLFYENLMIVLPNPDSL